MNALVHYSPIDFEMLQIKMDDVARRPKDGRVVISYVGALEPRKNLAFFVEVAKKILDITDKYCFHIYGDAKDQESLHYVESLMQGLDSRTLSRLSFKGYVPVQEAIVETDILICPFNNEPLGRVVPEFLYFGKTVIVTDSGGLKEAGAGYAICYVHNSVSDCVEKVLNCSGPTKNIEIIRRKLTEVFAPQGVVVKDMTVYREIGGVKR
ncbi:hypothetical protein GCM10009090_14150 [[Pseudomonas] boreopolis]|uniref:Glycosyl transferase family 1 domain-containing protein n=1 Tax=Xanthomonas boreopolis TaxID=86183 RepID=A0A919KHB0_9XANT|nr:hypothetical protein GCM10009090_14150 [[Pseudomonas] boreopolis]